MHSPPSWFVSFALGVLIITSIPQEYLSISTFAPDGNITFIENKNVTVYLELQSGSEKINYIGNLNRL